MIVADYLSLRMVCEGLLLFYKNSFTGTIRVLDANIEGIKHVTLSHNKISGVTLGRKWLLGGLTLFT